MSSALMEPIELDMYYIRDTLFKVYVRFNRITPDEVADWDAVMRLRRHQADSSPTLQEITGEWQVADPDYPNEALCLFEMPASITRTLPSQGCVYYVDLVPIANQDQRERSLQGNMIAGD